MTLIKGNRTTHGMKHSKIYSVWCGMKTRCLNPNALSYKHYGGRGVLICNEWLDFENFYDDMGECPEGHTLDRIDNNGNYELNNCRWATKEQQDSNKQNSRFVTYKGITKTIAQWERLYNMPQNLLRGRLKLDWTLDMAFNTKTLNKGQRYETLRS